MFKKLNFMAAFMLLTLVQLFANPILNDPTKAYSMPLLTKTANGDVLFSWTEKDQAGMVGFCFSVSKDLGKTFSDKKIIYSGTGIGNSRLMRAKLLVKKDGSLVAVFSNRGNANNGKRTLDIVYCTSKDQGNTWTAPQSVDSDPTTGNVKGFFDAVVLPNDEIAVAYLKDVAGSTKHEERDLRLVLTKNGVFQPEKVIDPVVCDCCNISLLIDAKGALNIYYRDNNDEIRDMATMTSTDNGLTFSKSQILHNDQWKINGCPHSGAISTVFGQSALITWFSGAESEKGIRLVTQEGKKLAVINDPFAKNAYVAADAKNAVFMWEQNNAQNITQIAYKTINANKVSETYWIKEAENVTNSAGLLAGNQLLVVYEVRNENGKNSINWSKINL